MKDLQGIQAETAARFGVDPLPPDSELKVGIAGNVRAGVQPLNALRHSPEGDTSGWYIWAGEELSNDRDFFVALCWSYLDELTPYDLYQSDGRRVRALLCVLEPDGDQEAAGLTAEWLVDMLEGEPRAD